MKKFLLFSGIAFLVIILLFGSCSNEPDTTDDVTPTIQVTQNVISTPTPTATPEPTPKPTEKPTAKPTNPPTIAPTEKTENETEMVWITKSGKKYHSHSGCSNMKAPYQVTKENAINSGRGPCSKCY